MSISNFNPYQTIQEAQEICYQTILNNTNAKAGNFGAANSGGINPADDSSNGVSGPSATNPVGDSNLSPNDATAEACGLLGYLALLTNYDLSKSNPTAEAQIKSMIAQLQQLLGSIPANSAIYNDVQAVISNYQKNGMTPAFDQSYQAFWNPSSGNSPLQDALNWLSTNNYNPANASPDVGFALAMLLLSTSLTPSGKLGDYGDLLNWLGQSGGVGAGTPDYLEQFLFLYADQNAASFGLDPTAFRELIANMLPAPLSTTDAYGQFVAQMDQTAANWQPMDYSQNPPQPLPPSEWPAYLNALWSDFLAPYYP